MKRAGPIVGAAVLVSLSWSLHARADEVSDLLERGVSLRKQHRNEEALALFERAARIAPSPPVLAQVALAEQALGHWLDAARDLDTVLSSSGDPWIAKNLEAILGAQGVVAQHVAWLTVEVDVASADIVLDGRPLAHGIETRVPSGPAVLEVRATGYAPDIRNVALAPTEHAHVTATLVALTPPSAPAAAPDASAPSPATPAAASVLSANPIVPEGQSPSRLPIGPLVLGGVGLAALATGTYFGVRTLTDKSDRDAQCVGGCKQGALAADSDARTSATFSTVSFAAGGALVVAAGVWWWLGRGGAGSSSGAALEIVPVVGAGVGGIVARGAL